MNKIKFSNDYVKLPVVWEGTQAMLIAVYPISVKYLKLALPQFIEYDTAIRSTYPQRGPGAHYPLDFDEGLILAFIHINSGVPFTTIRRDYPKKREYYTRQIGYTFTLERS